MIFLKYDFHGCFIAAESSIDPLPSIVRVVPSQNHLASEPQLPQTVTLQSSVKLPSAVVAVIVVVPMATGVTMPSATVATAGSEEVHVTVLSAAFSGSTVATRVTGSSPTVRFNSSALRLTPVTATVS